MENTSSALPPDEDASPNVVSPTARAAALAARMPGFTVAKTVTVAYLNTRETLKSGESGIIISRENGRIRSTSADNAPMENHRSIYRIAREMSDENPHAYPKYLLQAALTVSSHLTTTLPIYDEDFRETAGVASMPPPANAAATPADEAKENESHIDPGGTLLQEITPFFASPMVTLRLRAAPTEGFSFAAPRCSPSTST